MMARGKLTHPITPAHLREQGVTRKEYCAYLDTLAHYQSMGAGAGLRRSGLPPGRITPPPKQQQGG